MKVGLGDVSLLSCQFFYSWKLQMLCVLAKKKVINKYNDLITQVFGENPETSLSGWGEEESVRHTSMMELFCEKNWLSTSI